MASITISDTLPSFSLYKTTTIPSLHPIPLIVYAAETWSPTQQLSRNISGSVVSMLHTTNVPEGLRILNKEVHRHTNHPPLTCIIHITHLKLATSHVLIHPWTTVEPSGPVWPLCQGTETTDQSYLLKLGSRQLNPMSLHSTLVCECLLLSIKSTVMECAHGNGNVH